MLEIENQHAALLSIQVGKKERRQKEKKNHSRNKAKRKANHPHIPARPRPSLRNLHPLLLLQRRIQQRRHHLQARPPPLHLPRDPQLQHPRARKDSRPHDARSPQRDLRSQRNDILGARHHHLPRLVQRAHTRRVEVRTERGNRGSELDDRMETFGAIAVFGQSTLTPLACSTAHTDIERNRPQ